MSRSKKKAAATRRAGYASAYEALTAAGTVECSLEEYMDKCEREYTRGLVPSKPIKTTTDSDARKFRCFSRYACYGPHRIMRAEADLVPKLCESAMELQKLVYATVLDCQAEGMPDAHIKRTVTDVANHADAKFCKDHPVALHLMTGNALDVIAFEKYLYVLFIMMRTTGDQKMENFLKAQAIMAELNFIRHTLKTTHRMPHPDEASNLRIQTLIELHRDVSQYNAKSKEFDRQEKRNKREANEQLLNFLRENGILPDQNLSDRNIENGSSGNESDVGNEPADRRSPEEDYEFVGRSDTIVSEPQSVQ
jgi:hypothetical protein